MAVQVPATLKAISPYLKTALEYDKRDPVVAYYCKYNLKYSFCYCEVYSEKYHRRKTAKLIIAFIKLLFIVITFCKIKLSHIS